MAMNAHEKMARGGKPARIGARVAASIRPSLGLPPALLLLLICP
jgi:hypothetical protein